jgi:hypothetical protein
MSKAELITRIESIHNQEILNSIELFISQWDFIDVPISIEEKRTLEIGIQQANKKELKDHTLVLAEIRNKIGK